MGGLNANPIRTPLRPDGGQAPRWWAGAPLVGRGDPQTGLVATLPSVPVEIAIHHGTRSDFKISHRNSNFSYEKYVL